MMLKLTIFVILLYFCVVAFCQSWHDRSPIVRTEQGVIEGKKEYTESFRTIDTFLGIPYALPPQGKLRFSPPLKHPGWNGTLQVTNFAPRCPQLPYKAGVTDIEDCLYLNLWAPENSGTYALLPVVIFFEGKDFSRSISTPINGQDFAAEGVVVITVSYRLNIFGFFCLGTEEFRGNLGLLDQYLALLWVKGNVKHFGGDPERITLYGHYSGATSVTLHMVSPRTAGLFQRAILSSGSAVAPWELENDTIKASKQLLRILGCDTYSTNYRSCLRAKSVEQLLHAFQEYTESFTWTDTFLPVVDTFLQEKNRYLPIDPKEALKAGTYLQVPILTGVTRPIADPQFVQWSELASQGFFQLQQYAEKAKIPEIMRLYRFSNAAKEEIFELIKWKYSSFTQGDFRILFEQLKNLEFEAKLEAPHFMQISFLTYSYIQPIYLYFLEDIGLIVNATDSLITTDLILLFGPMLLKQFGRLRFNTVEFNLSKLIKRMWTNFIIFGNPTPNNQSKSWNKYTATTSYIETFGTTLLNVEEMRKRDRRIYFWNNLLPKISSSKYAPSNIPREWLNSPDPAAGFRHAMYTLVGLVVALLALLVICIILIKKRSKERETQLHMGY